MSPGHESDILQGREAGIKTWLFLCPPLIMDVLTENEQPLPRRGGMLKILHCFIYFSNKEIVQMYTDMQYQ